MVYLAPAEIFKNMLQRSALVYILKEFRITNGYFHIEITISAAHMLRGSEACSPRKF